MAETNLPTEDDVLRRMLATPPAKHKPIGGRPPRKDKGGTRKPLDNSTVP